MEDKWRTIIKLYTTLRIGFDFANLIVAVFMSEDQDSSHDCSNCYEERFKVLLSTFPVLNNSTGTVAKLRCLQSVFLDLFSIYCYCALIPMQWDRVLCCSH